MYDCQGTLVLYQPTTGLLTQVIENTTQSYAPPTVQLVIATNYSMPAPTAPTEVITVYVTGNNSLLLNSNYLLQTGIHYIHSTDGITWQTI